MRPPMMSSVSAVPTGTAGVAQIVATLDQLKNYYGRLPAIRSAALQIAGPTANHDQAGQVNALAAFVRGAVVYVADPINAEFIQTPDRLLLEINSRGFTYGDCDDHCLLFASLCEAVGIPCTIAGVSAGGSGLPDHVIVVAQLDGGPLEFDLVAKGVSQPSYSEKLLPPSS